MNLVFVLALLVVPCAGALAYGVVLDRRPRTSPGALRRVWDRSAASAERLGERATPAGGAVLIAAVGLAVIVPLFYVLGRLAKATEPFDRWVFSYFHGRAPHPHWWDYANNILTKTGNTLQTRVVIVTMVTVLLIVWRGRRRWLPPVMIVGTYLAEYFLQKFEAKIVHRGHPPTTHGTWPSGGCARIVAVYGICLFFLLLATRASRRTVIVASTALAVAEIIEAYTRVYLSKHWLSDVIGGPLFGGALLLVAILTSRAALVGSGRDREPADGRSAEVAAV